MIKRIVNRSIDYLTALPTVERRWINQLKGKVSCLLYHRVEDYGQHAFLDEGGSPVISEADLEREFGYLRALPAKFYTLADLNKGHFPDKDTIGIVICFDDGFKCNYEQGLSLLKKHTIPAVFFQCTGFINAKSLNWEHLLYWLNQHPKAKSALMQRINNKSNQTNFSTESIHYIRENISSKLIEEQANSVAREFGFCNEIEKLASRIYPDKQMIINAISQGIEIASHGHNHYKRKTISDELFKLDLKQSNDALSEFTQQQSKAYSYPFNSYSSNDHAIVGQYFNTIANVEFDRIRQPITNQPTIIPRLTWPGISPNQYRLKRWLLTGKF